jgi:hypothetical protein
MYACSVLVFFLAKYVQSWWEGRCGPSQVLFVEFYVGAVWIPRFREIKIYLMD